MDYAKLKAADAALGIADLAGAAEGLTAQTTTIAVDVPVSQVLGFLLVQGILPEMQAWAAAHPTDTTGILGVIMSLQALVTAPNIQSVEMSDAATAGAVGRMMGALVSAGLMTAAQQAAILAMATSSVCVWGRAVSVADVQIARAQP